jgi:hypothetical protein
MDHSLAPAPTMGSRCAPLWGTRVLLLLGVLASLAPVPVTALKLLPVYQSQARFLIFYAPFTCLLLLGYLLYVRDGLARALFGSVLRGQAPRRRARTRREKALGQSLGRVLLVLLPILLVATSVYCVASYLRLLDESVSQLGLERTEQHLAEEEVGLARTDRPQVSGRPSRVDRVPATLVPRIPASEDPGRLLRLASIDDVPFFAELAAWYIGAFAATVAAIVVMTLKEYAVEALGFSERDLVRRRSPPR